MEGPRRPLPRVPSSNNLDPRWAWTHVGKQLHFVPVMDIQDGRDPQRAQSRRSRRALLIRLP
jgi:hypothetical protein